MLAFIIMSSEIVTVSSSQGNDVRLKEYSATFYVVTNETLFEVCIIIVHLTCLLKWVS